jgi:hypothetical protein
MLNLIMVYIRKSLHGIGLSWIYFRIRIANATQCGSISGSNKIYKNYMYFFSTGC